MLIDFRVKNHRSLRDEQVLTMDAGALAMNLTRGHGRSPAIQKSFWPSPVCMVQTPAARATCWPHSPSCVRQS